MQVLVKMDPVRRDNDVQSLLKTCHQVDGNIRNFISS